MLSPFVCPLAPPLLARTGLSSWDLAIVAVYLLATVVWGAWPRKGAGTDEAYLVGGRDTAWYALLLSIIATETSTVTFLSLPGQTYAEGGDMRFLQITLGYIVGRLGVIVLLMPLYFRGKPFTAYQVLSERYGEGVRAAASLTFLVCRTLADGLRLFLTTLALQQAIALDFTLCVVIVAAATTIYATLGGVSSVVKNDCVQLIVYTSGALIALLLLSRAIPGGIGEVWRFADETGRLRVFDPGLGLFGGHITFWSGLVGGGFLSLATHGVDQLMVQRYLCARSKASASLALALSGPLVAAQFFLFLLIGAALACFYSSGQFGYSIASGDQAFAAYLAHEVPIGVAGLLFAAVLAAAMSTLSSSLNASAGVLVKDLLAPSGIATDSGAAVWWAKVGTVLFAVLQVGVALGANAVGLAQSTSVISAVLAVAALTTGVLVGLFALGFGWPRSSTRAAYGALVTGFAFSFFLAGLNFGIDQQWPALAGWRQLSWPWNSLVACSTTLLGGLVVHAFAGPNAPAKIASAHASAPLES
ncbi:sodium:solute symporter family transporter [Botrimarina hoheduenensis]|uniref:Sodium/glucose cotransporter n=1 Tax=Botrimarina hoheduenensis TaxID=2528000 RepID=A0A5C5WFH7_9BACT|nr:transporter [Botrimarina hoheduenensis]TWT48833.1 Sodium/glucose cotransporter [Botrimarina hoheduenensis]